MTNHRAQRLSMATLARARVRWCHSTSDLRPQRITHLGVGAFARAHLGVYADDLNRRGWPALIRGVSLMSDRAEREMEPQDGLYTVAEREPDEEPLCGLSVRSHRSGPGQPPQSRPSPHPLPIW
jgi:fructuronate reductase